MNVFEQFIRKIIEFRVPNITERQKDIYIYTILKLMLQYEKMKPENFSEFNNLKKIVITTDTKDIPCLNAIGCSTANAVYSVYFNNLDYDSIVISMELAHFAVASYYKDMKVSNDLIHYAANVGAEPYVSWIKYKYLTKKDWLLRNPAVEVPIFVYNMDYLMKEKSRIMAEVIAGKAPKGINKYWSGLGATEMPKELLEYLHHYHHEGDDDHAD